ncbi:MAG: polysaccharide pyruvyl transferase family protein [Clostridia bacterium]|nr:polysaccharide pyruvyl transferase family protein [Clostridia bacterium]
MILLYNHGGCENRGCEAIVRATSEIFRQEAGCDACLASATPEYDRSVGLDAIDRIVPDRIGPYSIHRIINSIGFRLGMPREQEVARKHLPVIREGRRSELCLSVGGDTYCYGRQEHLLVINGRLRRVGRPSVLWGCSIEPKLIEGERLEDLRQYSLIVARESITAEALRKAGLPVRQWCDPAFFLRQEKLPLPEGWKENGTIGVNVSPLVLDCAQDKSAAFDAFVALIRHTLESTDNAVALIPHVTWAHDNDMDALTKLKEAFADEPRVFMLPGTLGAMQYKGYISRLRALVTARTHASIAAYSTAVPTLVIGYSVKAKGIARDLFGDETGHLIPVQELGGAGELIAAFDALLAREEEERAYLTQRLPSYTAGRREIVRELLALGGGQAEGKA